MTQEMFAAVGAFATFGVSVLVIGILTVAAITSLRDWLDAKSGLVDSVNNLMRTQRALLEARNKLDERMTAIEDELRGDAE